MRNLDQLARKLASRQDAMMRDLLCGATAGNAAPQEPLTLELIQRLACDLRAKIGPTPIFLSSKLFPADKALSVENATAKYVCAHPGFWARVQYEAARMDAVEATKPTKPLLAPMFGLQIYEIDPTEGDDPARREFLNGIWRDLREAMKVAMTPLPDWIWNAPKFTQHG